MFKINSINVGFNNEDETINFGKRSAAINANNLYEVTTLASIDVDQNVNNDTPMQGLSLPEGLAISFKNIFILFKNESCLEVIFSHEFQASIDHFYITNNLYALICLRDGKIYFLQLESGKNKLFYTISSELHMKKEEKFFCDSYIYLNNDLYNIVFTTTSGQIYCSSIQPLEFFDENYIIKTPSLILNEKSIGHADCFYLKTLKLFYSQNAILHVMEKDFGSNEISFAFNGIEILKIQYSHISRKILCLLSDNSLISICAHTYIISNIFNHYLIKDFNIINCSNSQSESLLNILYENKGKLFFESIIYPEMTSKFTIQVNDSSSLISIPSIDQEIIFLENSKNTVFIKLITETKPTDRFERLLRRKNFSEAETFATIYNLDKNLLYNLKIKDLITKIHISQDSSDSTLFENLCSIFEKITDKKVILDFFRYPPIIKLEYFKKLLLITRNKLEFFKENERLMITNLNLYLDTYSLIYKNSSDERWIYFFTKDIYESYIELLNQGEINNAILLWNRHRNEIEKRLDSFYIDKILNNLPVNLDLNLFHKWFCHFFLIVLKINPDSINNILKWLIKKIKSLEMNSEEWPENMISFTHKLNNYFDYIKLKIESQELNLYNINHLNYTFFINNIHYDNIILISEACKEILILKQNFQIYTFLEHYLQDDKLSLIKHILEHYHHERISYLLENYLNNFMIKHKLNPDDILKEIIIENASDANFSILSGDELESNVLSLIYCIKNLDTFINCVSIILDNVAIPWCAQIEKLFDHTKSLKHPKAQEVITQKRNMQLKLIYKKYGIKLVNSNILPEANIDRLIYLNADLDDILQLVQGSENLNLCYYKYITHLIKQGNINKAFEIFQKLQPSNSIKICLKFINKIIFSLNHPLIYLDGSSFIIESLYKFKNFLIKQNKFKYQQYINLIDDLNNVFKLNLKYNISVKFSDYKNDLHNVYDQNIDYFLNNDIHTIYDIKRFSQLLKLNGFEIVSYLVKYLNSRENLTLSFEIIEWIMDSYLIQNQLDTHFLNFIKNIFIGNFICKEDDKQITSTCFTTWSKFPDVTFTKWIDYANNFDIIDKFNLDRDNTKMIIQTVLNRPTLNILYKGSHNDTDSSNNINTYLKKSLEAKYYLDHEKGDESETYLKSMIDFMFNLKKSKANMLKITYLFHNYYKTIFPKRCDSEYLKETNPQLIDTDFILNLLNNVIKDKLIDQTLSLSLLTSLDQEDSLHWLNSKLKENELNISRNAQITALGVIYCNLQILPAICDNFQYNLTILYWKKIFYKYSLLNDEISFTEPEKTIFVLLKNNLFKDFSQIKLYCKNFNLDFDKCMLTYMNYILLSWKPEIHCEMHNGEHFKYSVTNNYYDIYYKCVEIISEMKNLNNLVPGFCDILKKANYYYYEIFLCVGKLLKYLNYQGVFEIYQVIFLMNYQRISSPDESEYEVWFKTFPEATAIDPISKWRLPLYPFYHKDISLIYNEISLVNYLHWIKYTKNLGVEKNVLCGMAIKNSFKYYEPVKSDWLIFNNNKYLLEQISECSDYMTDLKFACATVYNIINRIQPGKDQVDASLQCLTIAKKWVRASPSDSQEIIISYNKVLKRYLNASIKHVLYSHNFANSKYMDLMSNGEVLIKALYDDLNILKENNIPSPNINKAVEEIAHIYELNLSKLQFQIIQSYLFLLEDKLAVQEHIKIDNIKRISYILKSKSSSKVISEMINFIKNDADLSLQLQYHAWKIILGYITPSTNLQILNLSIESLENYIIDLYFLNKFRSADINFPLDYFQKNKFNVKLFNEIMKIHSKNKKVLSFYADMCLFNKIYDNEYWNVLLVKMCENKMFNKLKELLPLLHDNQIISCNTLQAWQFLVTYPFQKDNFDMEEEMEEYIDFIKLCPFLSWLDVESIIKWIKSKEMDQKKHVELKNLFIEFLSESQKKM